MKTERSYLSKDNQTEIHAIEWTPENEPVAILQIAHGMVEFINRYDRFARYLNEKGIIVVGNDHLGHGQSVSSPNQLGFFVTSNAKLKINGEESKVYDNEKGPFRTFNGFFFSTTIH